MQAEDYDDENAPYWMRAGIDRDEWDEWGGPRVRDHFDDYEAAEIAAMRRREEEL